LPRSDLGRSLVVAVRSLSGRDHRLIAADLIAAARAGDETAVADAESRWTANADEIATFLAGANPRSWDLDEMKTMLHEHLRLTANEAIARIQGDWAADVAAYDQIHVQALGMADMLSNGIIEQFRRASTNRDTDKVRIVPERVFALALRDDSFEQSLGTETATSCRPSALLVR
jgi:hypothetical protein